MVDVLALSPVTGSNGTLTVVERLANLLESGQFADFTFKVGAGDDTTTFKAHKMLLATASQPLHSIVTSCLQPENGSTDNYSLSVTDIDPESFQHLLKYIYTDDVRVSSIGEALNLIRYSEKWSLGPLGIKTIKFMHQFLDEFEPFSEEMKNDLCDLLIWSEKSNDASINKRSWEVMMKNINEVVPCQNFLNMDEEMVRKILIHENFNYKNQLALFEAIRDWGMNQILTKHLNVNQLQSVIAGLLQHINFKDIGDGDFASTIMPSECLGRADLIAFFLCRGQEMPRDFGVNKTSQVQNVVKWASTVGQEKCSRFKKAFKIRENEINNAHELRFRVDRDICLLGVGFGYLFSNVDMGVTVHCQGPWETRQWTDIVQTYCRVTYEEMTTTNVKLMFNEPVILQANQSYKILAKIGRMSAGASDVEIWGGCDATTTVNAKDVNFYFLKNSVPPHRDVQEQDKDNSPCLVTDLIYQLEFDPLSRIDTSLAPSLIPSTVISSIDTSQTLAINPSPSIPSKTSPVSSPSSALIPLATKTPRKNINQNKENIIPIKEEKPELPWLNRRTTIINNREDKPLLSPFRKSRPSDSSDGEKVTLPWQRKGSTADTTGSFVFRSKPLSSYTPLKSNTAETKISPWKVKLNSRPSFSEMNKSNEFPISNSLKTSASPYKKYSPYSGTLNSPKSGLGSSSIRSTDKYSSSIPGTAERGSITSKYISPSNRLGQPLKDYTSSSLSNGYSTHPNAFSSSYEKPSSNLNSYSSSNPERSKVSSNQTDKYSSPSIKPSSYNNVPYRSSIARLSSSRESASRMNDPKSTTDVPSRYQRSNESISKFGQPSSYDRQSNMRNTNTSESTPKSKLGQAYSPSSYSSYKNYRSTDVPSSLRSRAFSPSPRYGVGNSSSSSYPYSSKISSISSKWQPPSSSSYYRR